MDTPRALEVARVRKPWGTFKRPKSRGAPAQKESPNPPPKPQPKETPKEKETRLLAEPKRKPNTSSTLPRAIHKSRSHGPKTGNKGQQRPHSRGPKKVNASSMQRSKPVNSNSMLRPGNKRSKRMSVGPAFFFNEDAPGMNQTLKVLKGRKEQRKISMSTKVLEEMKLNATLSRERRTTEKRERRRTRGGKKYVENYHHSKDERIKFKTLTRFLQRVHSNPKVEAYKVGFNYFEIPDEQLIDHIDVMAAEFGLLQVYREPERLRNLATAIKNNYKSNPFHNFKHAFGVAHMAVVFMIREKSIPRKLRHERVLAFIVAALGHDLDHPGNDNSFEVTTYSALTAQYGEDGVLECYHATVLLRLLRDDANNVFIHSSYQAESDLREFVVSAVLATDMKQHLEHVNVLRSTQDFKKAMKSDIGRETLMYAIIHACDLSGQTAELEVAINWEERITEEFRNQAEKLQAANKPVPAHISNSTPRKRAKQQVKFIDAMVAPLWKEVARVMPGMEPFYGNLTRIVRRYYEILYRNGEEEANTFVETLQKHRKKKEEEAEAVPFNQSGNISFSTILRTKLNYPPAWEEESDDEAEVCEI